MDDDYEVKTEVKRLRIKDIGLLFKKVVYSEAINFYADIIPAEESDRIKFLAASFHKGKRQSKIGRPTKKQKRDIDDFLENRVDH